MASKLYEYTPAELQKLLDESNGYSDVLRKIGMNPKGSNSETLKKIIAEYNLDETKLNENRRNLYSKCGKDTNDSNRYSLEDILAGKHPGYQSSRLLERLIKAGYKTMMCECCGITEWLGKPITFHLHHKNGEHDDNQLENLEVLCPNCHSQTDNYAGKSPKRILNDGVTEDGSRLYIGNRYKVLCPECKENFIDKTSKMYKKCNTKNRRKPKISKEELFKIMESNSYYSAASILGVDKDTVSRWHKYYVNEENQNNSSKMIGSDKAPTRDVLKTKIRTMSFIQIGKEYDVTDNSVRRWCEKYNLPKSKREIRNYSDEEWEKI